MFKPKQILVATDFSTHSQAGLNAAISVARSFGGRITLAHVVPVVADATPATLAGLEEALAWADGTLIGAETVRRHGSTCLIHGPDLLAQLQASEAPIERQLTPPAQAGTREAALSEAAFRYALNDDAMATEKLAEGIRLFAADARKLDQLIR